MLIVEYLTDRRGRGVHAGGDRIAGHPAICMLLAQCLPGLVIAHNFPPSSRDLRSTNECFGVIDKFEYLLKSKRGKLVLHHIT